MRSDLPTGTVTFMFTDIEGSTALLHDLGADRFAVALHQHRAVVRSAVTEHAGMEVDTQGDAFFAVFPTAPQAVEAALAAQARLAARGDIQIRVGLHTGTPLLADEGYVGPDVHLGARIASAGHGGQVLLSAQTRALVEGDFRDLGEHRLKDFDRPLRIYQLGNAPFAPLKTLTTSNLPRPATSFVGRSSDVAQVLSMVSDRGARLVTLTGPGGCGKTRLAIEVAAELVGIPTSGVFWVGLAALDDPALVLPTIAQTLGASVSVADHIAEREMVLVLDNLEHVIAAAADLADLVERCPRLTLIATSRERLRVRVEREYAVPALQEPDAVALFTDRAQVTPDDDVHQLCARLDYLPLALELAAARASVLTPRQMLDRLGRQLDLLKGGRDVDRRQQTLRATIDWSHDLLSAEEQELFARFSIFVGGADLDAAEVVIDADVDLLQSLVDKSLVRFSDGRFWMLETIRGYAAERLSNGGQTGQVVQAHAEYFTSIAEAAQPAVMSIRPNAALNRLEREHDNLRAALMWLESSGDVQGALHLAGMLWEFWCLRTHFEEGYRRLEHLLSLDATATPARANALTGSTHLAPGAGADIATMRARAAEALALQLQFGSAWDVAFAEDEYAHVFTYEGDFEAALAHMRPVVERWREVGDEHRELQAMRQVARAYEELGDMPRSRQMHEEILRRARAIGDMEPQWWSLRALANLHSRAGELADAIDCLRQAYAAQQEGEDDGTDLTVSMLAVILARAGAVEAATLAFGLAERLGESDDFVYLPWLAEQRDEGIARCRELLSETTFRTTWRQGRGLSPDDLFRVADEVVASRS